MKFNIKVAKTCNNTTVEFTATDVEGQNFFKVRDDLLNQLNKTFEEIPQENTTNYQPATSTGGNPISQKQVAHLRGLGYTGNLDGLTITEASELIQQIYKEKGITGKWHK